MKYVIKLAILISLLTGCNKKTEVRGYVYSKHGAPVLNGNVILEETTSPKVSGDSWIKTTTDNNGYYQFTFKGKRNYMYYVRCESDSGLALGVLIRDNKTNNIVLDTY